MSLLVHAGRDRILLEGEDETFDDGDEEEVFGLKGLDQDDDDDDDDVDMDGFEDEDGEAEEAAASAKSKSKKAEKKSKGKKKTKGELSSDEEEDAPQEEEETWGSGKAAYYNGNDDELESDDEEGHELELQEAKRLQAKAREDMTDDDFGLNDIHEVQKDDVECVLFSLVPRISRVVANISYMIALRLRNPHRRLKLPFQQIRKNSYAISRRLVLKLWLSLGIGKICPSFSLVPRRTLQSMTTVIIQMLWALTSPCRVEQEKPDYPHLGTLHLYYRKSLPPDLRMVFAILTLTKNQKSCSLTPRSSHSTSTSAPPRNMQKNHRSSKHTPSCTVYSTSSSP